MEKLITLIAGLILTLCVHSQPIAHPQPVLPASGTALQSGDTINAGNYRIANSAVTNVVLNGGTIYVLSADSAYISNLTINDGSIIVAGRFETPLLDVTGNFSFYNLGGAKSHITSANLANNYDTLVNQASLWIGNLSLVSTKNWFLNYAKLYVDSVEHFSSTVWNKGCLEVDSWIGNVQSKNKVSGTGGFNIAHIAVVDSFTNDTSLHLCTWLPAPNLGTATVTIANTCTCDPGMPNTLIDYTLKDLVITGPGVIYDMVGRPVFKGDITELVKRNLPAHTIFIVKIDSQPKGFQLINN